MAFVCPSSEKCPIFNGILQGKDFTTKLYKMQYCENETKRDNCKRWQCKSIFSKVPENLLPNAIDTIEEIGRKFGYV